MANTFLISDTHFSHGNIIKFTHEDGVSRIRYHWDTVEEMDEAIIDNWNCRVTSKDRVWVLGDFVMNRRFLPIANRLNGRLKLIMGNHDIFKATDYLTYFEDVKGSHVLDRCFLSHVPIHPSSLSRFRMNIHGHYHQRRVLLPNGTIDHRYQSVCVEQIDYTPISLDEVIARHDKEKAEYENGISFIETIGM